MYGCEMAECWRIDAFELWCWIRLLRVPWTAKRSNQSILKESNPEYLLERLMLKLKLQYSGHLVQTADSLEKTLMLGKTEVRGRKRRQRMKMVGWHHRLNGHEFEQTLEMVKDREAWYATVHGVAMSWKGLSHWRTTAASIRACTWDQPGKGSCWTCFSYQRFLLQAAGQRGFFVFLLFSRLLSHVRL